MILNDKKSIFYNMFPFTSNKIRAARKKINFWKVNRKKFERGKWEGQVEKSFSILLLHLDTKLIDFFLAENYSSQYLFNSKV